MSVGDLLRKVMRATKGHENPSQVANAVKRFFEVQHLAMAAKVIWAEHRHLTAKQVVAKIRNLSHGKIKFEDARDAVLVFLMANLPEGETTEDGDDATSEEDDE